MDFDLNSLPERELFSGFIGRFVHTLYSTQAFWHIKAGAVLPLHHHVHEQTTQVTKGQFELTVDGVTRTYGPGTLVHIPPNVPHSGRALTDCEIVDVFCPVREDYR